GWIWKIFSSFRVPARFYFLFLFLTVVSGALFWSRRLAASKPLFKAALLLLILADLYLNGKKMIWAQNLNDTMANRGLLQELSEKNSMQAPFRVFSGEKIANPNKTMLFHLENINGYEALWQGSALKYWAWTQGGPAITTTGLKSILPQKNSALLHGLKYYI